MYVQQLVWVTLLLGSSCTGMASGVEESDHSHHVTAAVGIARHKGNYSEFWGVDYAYTFHEPLYVLGFYDQARGEFNISTFGIQLGTYFGHGWKAAIGPGVETKLKSGDNLLLIRATIEYDWHRGNWSYGPIASYDAVEDISDTLYLGFAMGYKF